MAGFEETDHRPVQQFTALRGPRKAQALINLLLRNKESLGIKRLAEKHELLRKREEERVKMQNTRLTSSINRDYHNRNSLFQFEEIAKEILKKHMKYRRLVRDGVSELKWPIYIVDEVYRRMKQHPQ